MRIWLSNGRPALATRARMLSIMYSETITVNVIKDKQQMLH